MNNHEEIISGLRKLRALKPSPVFAGSLKAALLRTGTPNHFYGFFGLPNLKLAVYGGTLAVAFLIFSYFVFAPSKPVVSAAFNPENLSNELANLSINIQLQEVKYQQNANLTIVSALSEIENTNVKHLNETLIEAERESVDLEESTNPAIDEMLNSVIF